MLGIKLKEYESGKRSDIQIARGLSIVGVLLFHSSDSLIPNGYLGVDIFFLISGFLVTPLILKAVMRTDLNNREKYFEFFSRRIFRLIPALGVMILSNNFLMLIFGNSNQILNYAKQSILSLFALGNVGAYLYSGNYFNPAPNPLIHTWSLGAEEQIYLFLTVYLTFLCKRNINFKKVRLVYVFLILISLTIYLITNIGKFDLDIIGIANKNEFFFYFFPTRLWEFCAGGIVYLNRKIMMKKFSSFPKLQMFIFLLLLIIIAFPIHIHQQIATVVSILLGTIFLVTRGVDKFTLFPNKILVWVGLRSYSIYLWHLPMIYFARYSPFFSSYKFSIWVALLATFAFANFSYTRIEVPWILNQGKSKYQINKLMKKFIFIPFIFSMILIVGVNNDFWGLDKNVVSQPYAGTSDPSCLRDSEDGEPCRYEVRGSNKNVLMIGDSHAAHLSQALINAGQVQGWNVEIWTASGCRFQLVNSTRWSVTSKCIKRNRAIVQKLKNNTFDMVIVSQYVHTDSPFGVLEDALKVLKSQKNHILYIENTPVFPEGRASLVGRPLIISGSAPENIPRSEMSDFENPMIRKFYSRVRNIGVETMNLNDLFCDLESCHRFRKKVGWLYIDNDHLSILGSSLAEKRLQFALR